MTVVNEARVKQHKIESSEVTAFTGSHNYFFLLVELLAVSEETILRSDFLEWTVKSSVHETL